MSDTLTSFESYAWNRGLTIPLKSRRIEGGATYIVPKNVQNPTIFGIPTNGQMLNATPGQWSPSPMSFTYQWTRDGVNIGGATSTVYALTNADVGAEIACVVTAINFIGSSLPAISNQLGPIAAVLTISGTPVTTATRGVPYAGFTVSAAGGWQPRLFNLTSGYWPAGIGMDARTGVVSGTPIAFETQAGIVITVTDFYGLTASLPPFTITIAPPSLDFSKAGNSQYVVLGVV